MNAKDWFNGLSFNGRVNLGTPVTIKSAGGKDLTCKCGRVLYWDHIGGNDYRATCCNLVMFEKKAVTNVK